MKIHFVLLSMQFVALAISLKSFVHRSCLLSEWSALQAEKEFNLRTKHTTAIDTQFTPNAQRVHMTSLTWVHSSVARAADCRSAGPWFKSGCALLYFISLQERGSYEPSLLMGSIHFTSQTKQNQPIVSNTSLRNSAAGN